MSCNPWQIFVRSRHPLLINKENENEITKVSVPATLILKNRIISVLQDSISIFNVCVIRK